MFIRNVNNMIPLVSSSGIGSRNEDEEPVDPQKEKRNKTFTAIIMLVILSVCLWLYLMLNRSAEKYNKEEIRTFTIVGRNRYNSVDANGNVINIKAIRLKTGEPVREFPLYVSDKVYKENLTSETFVTSISERDIDKLSHTFGPEYCMIVLLLLLVSIFAFSVLISILLEH